MTPLSSAARKTRDVSENRVQVESAITKKRVADRIPFQTLLSNSPLRPASSLDCNCAVAGPADIAAGDLAIKLEDKLNNIAVSLCKDHINILHCNIFPSNKATDMSQYSCRTV